MMRGHGSFVSQGWCAGAVKAHLASAAMYVSNSCYECMYTYVSKPASGQPTANLLDCAPAVKDCARVAGDSVALRGI